MGHTSLRAGAREMEDVEAVVLVVSHLGSHGVEKIGRERRGLDGREGDADLVGERFGDRSGKEGLGAPPDGGVGRGRRGGEDGGPGGMCGCRS